MKILITEQQLSHILNESIQIKEDISAVEMIAQMQKRAANKVAVAFTSLGRLRTLESEDMKRKIKRLLDLCEKFEYEGGIFYVFQQIPSLRPENVVFKDNRREIALYLKPNGQNGFERNIIYFNKLVFNKLVFNKLSSKYNRKDIEYALKYNIIDVLIDEELITKDSFIFGIKGYYSAYEKNRRSIHPLSEWFDKFVHEAVTSEILQKTGLKNLKDLDLHSMKPDNFSDEGLSGFSKLKRNINKRLTGLDTKESYFVSKLADIFDLASRDENSSNVFNIPDGDGENHKIFHSHSLSCSVFLKNNPAIYDASLVSYFENIGYKFTDLAKKAAEKSSNTELKKSIKYCLSGNPIKVR